MGLHGDEVQSVVQRLLVYSDENKRYAFNKVTDPCPELTRTSTDDEVLDCAIKRQSAVWSVALADRAFCSWATPSLPRVEQRLLAYSDVNKSYAYNDVRKGLWRVRMARKFSQHRRDPWRIPTMARVCLRQLYRSLPKISTETAAFNEGFRLC